MSPTYASLPSELRNAINYKSLVSSRPICIGYGQLEEPALLSIPNRSLCLEAQRMYYGSNDFIYCVSGVGNDFHYRDGRPHVYEPGGLITWLQRIGPEKRAMLRKVECVFFAEEAFQLGSVVIERRLDEENLSLTEGVFKMNLRSWLDGGCAESRTSLRRWWWCGQ